jgi:proteasome lid subunit RPN8/RPN11
VRLTLPEALYDRLVDDARASPEDEICGLLAGAGEVCSAVYPVKNISPTPQITFYMDPQSQIDAMFAMRRSGEAMLGIYHSHPSTPALPSARDVAGAAYPGVAYLIISLVDLERPEVAAFVFDNGEFEPITLAIGIAGGP